jgi:hypothetical protein
MTVISRPARPAVSSSGMEPQVQWRLENVELCDPRYRVAKADQQVLLSAMRNPQLDLSGRLCAARFLLELDNTEARGFVSSYVIGENPAAANEAAYVLVEAAAPGRKWETNVMIR